MKRREFVRNSLLAGAALASSPLISPKLRAESVKAAKFKLRYAPHPNMFKASAGEDIIDQIKFAADQGFTAWEDNGLAARPVALQEQIGSTLDALGMKMGVFVAYGSFDKPTFVRPDPDSTEEILAKIRASVEVAKRVNAKHFTVVPGSVDQQHAGQEKWNKYMPSTRSPSVGRDRRFHPWSAA